jgi:transposase-like protein
MKYLPERWETAREMRVNGASLSEIARTIGVSRQGVAKREKKEGWLNQTGEPLPTNGMDPKRAVVMNLRRGCSIKLAAGAAGVHPNTVGNWMKKDPNYDVECRAAISLYGVDRTNDLTKASERGDVRATKLALERHAATREDFAPDRTKDETVIILNINRAEPEYQTGTVIDSEPEATDGKAIEHGKPTPIRWPNVQRPVIEGECDPVSNDGEKQE